jgi:hypothetical protein
MKAMKQLICGILLFSAAALYGEEWQSSRVRVDPSTGRLVYISDSAGNRIPDFSYAGYKGGGVDPPAVPVARTLSPAAGDNTARIQAVLDTIALLAPDSRGMRGALLLSAGVFEIHGTLRLSGSGVVLRGMGDGADPTGNTILVGKGNIPAQRTIIVAGSGSSSRWKEAVSGTTTSILDDTVRVGERRFRVANPAAFAAGDNIVIYHPCTGAWLAAIDSGGSHYTESGAEAGVDVPWTVNSQPILYNRFITAIRGDTITIDAPVFNPLVRALSSAYIYRYARTGLRTNIGIEHLRIDIETAGGTDEDHAWNAIELSLVEDCWVTSCTALHFGQAGFVTRTATRITMDSCKALEPVSVITGERRYNFNMYDGSQLILVRNALTTEGRHDYVSNGASWTSGCVFLDCRSEGTHASSEGHRRWTTGFLYDNVVFRSAHVSLVLGLYNRGHYGTSHGWGIAHSVAWNCDVGDRTLIVQQPPTGQNYAIGCTGVVTGVKPPAPFLEPEGFIEGTNRPGLVPVSLYRAQLRDRLENPVAVGRSETAPLPEECRLMSAFPNPFNGSTSIGYTIPAPGNVRITIVDLLGREVDILSDGRAEAGVHRVNWEAGAYASGVYVCRLQTGQTVQTAKIMHLR